MINPNKNKIRVNKKDDDINSIENKFENDKNIEYKKNKSENCFSDLEKNGVVIKEIDELFESFKAEKENISHSENIDYILSKINELINLLN